VRATARDAGAEKTRPEQRAVAGLCGVEDNAA
jgi:hypothetical protein